MAQRNEYPAGVPCWVDTQQHDPAAAADFYRALFGWTLIDRMPPGSPMPYFVAQIEGDDVAAVTGFPPGAPQGRVAWNTYVAVESADDAAARARAAGGAVAMEPIDVGPAGRMAVLADREGATLCVWQAGATIGAQRVNEHGTVNFNTLHTADRDAAAAFYGEVFGWEAAPMDPSGEGPWMWRLPGYSDVLERLTPGLKAGMDEMGAPAGFADAVALMAPLGAGPEPGDAPHWGVTFAVDDADAAARAAQQNGGTVLAPPVDAPWVRMSVLADPEGAVLTASQYVPPG